MEDLHSKIQDLVKENQSLSEKVDDFNNKSRHNNSRLIELKELISVKLSELVKMQSPINIESA